MLFEVVVGVIATCVTGPNVLADSAIDLLSGFDSRRIEAVYPATDQNSIGELAKLVYRLRIIDPDKLQSKVSPAASAGLGDAIAIEGTIRGIEAIPVPKRLVEFLEFDQLKLVAIDRGDAEIDVITSKLNRDAKVGDRVRGTGVVVEMAVENEGDQGKPRAIATSRLSWVPRQMPTPGWRLLSEAGMDVSLLPEVATRNRKVLMPQDGDAFYTMLAASASVGEREPLPTPTSASPVKLLSDPEPLTGHWLKLDLETVQVTRIAVTEPHRQNQLGSDHYYQIDAVADLGKVVIKVERPEQDPASADKVPSVLFENRYPVSIVIRELPAFLRTRIRQQEGGDAVISKVNLMIEVDGFFFRLWSYTTAFMQDFGDVDQFGPLLVAARIKNREPTTADPVGVGIIGWIAAIGIFSGILATWLWNRRVRQEDEEVREKRKQRETEQLHFP